MGETEAMFQKQVIKRLRMFHKVWCYKASDRFVVGIPDIIGCWEGHMFGIELKVGRNTATPLQLHTMAQMSEAGASVAIIKDLDALDYFIMQVKGRDKV